MIKKYFWFDVETTGVDEKKNDIIELSFIIVSGDQVYSKQLLCQPFDWDAISPSALEVNKRTIEELQTFPHPQETHALLLAELGSFVNKFDKEDKLIPCGHNVQFDIDFLREFFRKNNDFYYGSWFKNEFLCSMSMAMIVAELGYIDPENFKLSTLAEAYGIDQSKEHEGMSDVHTSRHLFRAMARQLKNGRPDDK